jgi:hypothetical protein
VTLSIYIDYNWYGTDVWGKDDISPLITAATGSA